MLQTLLQAGGLLGNFVKEEYRLLPSSPVGLLPHNGPVQISGKSQAPSLGTMLPGNTEPGPGVDEFAPLEHSMCRLLRAERMGQG
jgi:hypothetical protein